MSKGRRLITFTAMAMITAIALATTLSPVAPAAAASTAVRIDDARVSAFGMVTPQDAGNNGAWVSGVGYCADFTGEGDCWTWADVNNGTHCPSSHFCLYANARIGEGGKVFKFFHCFNGGSDWALQNWNGTGAYFNNNSGGSYAYLKDANHAVIQPSIPPRSGAVYNFAPVWFVQAC